MLFCQSFFTPMKTRLMKVAEEDSNSHVVVSSVSVELFGEVSLPREYDILSPSWIPASHIQVRVGVLLLLNIYF